VNAGEVPDGGVAQCPSGFGCMAVSRQVGYCCPTGTLIVHEYIIAADVDFCCPAGDVCGCQQDCPISRRAAKTAIRYLTPADVAAARDQLLAIHLADYEYRHAPRTRHLGFIIDDLDEATARACVAPDGEHVDLYGYTSLAVAALQAQQREIDVLRRELAELRALVRTRPQ
jgi:hypothetical protein